MNDSVYQLITGIIDLFAWGGELIGEENLPRRGPAVFIANHLLAIGPIAVICSIPLRLYPWIIGDMVDKEKAAAWLNWDFVERQLYLKPPFSMMVSKALSKFSVPMLRSLGCIPVYKGHENIHETWEESIKRLLEGKFLLVFPEDNMLEADAETKMTPFQKSFVRLAELYYKETNERLEFYPVAIHSSGFVMVGKSIAHNPHNPVGWERHRLKDLMEETIKRMYMQLEGGQFIGALTPEHK